MVKSGKNEYLQRNGSVCENLRGLNVSSTQYRQWINKALLQRRNTTWFDENLDNCVSIDMCVIDWQRNLTELLWKSIQFHISRMKVTVHLLDTDSSHEWVTQHKEVTLSALYSLTWDLFMSFSLTLFLSLHRWSCTCTSTPWATTLYEEGEQYTGVTPSKSRKAGIHVCPV